jgi:transcriptional regulator with GAF, ATPase, and Fis domain
MLDKWRVHRHIVAMPTRKQLTKDEILAALDEWEHDIQATAAALGHSERTLQRRMAELGIRARIRYEAAEAA